MSATQKIVRLFLLYLITAAVLLPNSGLLDTATADPPQLLARIPKDIGPWQGNDLDESKAREFFIVGEDTVFQPLVRTYRQNKGGPSIVLNALEDLKGFQRGIHDPRFCYESRGWTVQSFEDIPIAGQHASNTLKLLTYTNNMGTARRMEIYGYLADGDVITSDIALRLTHFRNRMMKMFRKPGGHLLYVGVSAELEQGHEKALLEDLKFLVGKILAALNSTQ